MRPPAKSLEQTNAAPSEMMAPFAAERQLSAHVVLPSPFLGEGLWLVDAGDYDADGQSELVFWFSDCNRDGYVLFSGDSAVRAKYLWNYH